MTMEDEELNALQNELKQLDEELSRTDSAYNVPKPEVKDSNLKFFRELLEKKDSTKFGNLDATELGKLKVLARPLKEIAVFAESQGLHDISTYLDAKAEITFSTSLSKKAKLLDTVVTQIKKEQKVEPKQEHKRFLFSRGRQEEEA